MRSAKAAEEAKAEHLLQLLWSFFESNKMHLAIEMNSTDLQ